MKEKREKEPKMREAKSASECEAKMVMEALRPLDRYIEPAKHPWQANGPGWPATLRSKWAVQIMVMGQRKDGITSQPLLRRGGGGGGESARGPEKRWHK